jgi:hypothetical protein
MAKAAATQLPSFTRQDAEEFEAAFCPPGTKTQKSRRSRAATLGPADARRACPRVGRRFVRVYVCQYHKVPKSQAIPDLNITFQVPNRS